MLTREIKRFLVKQPRLLKNNRQAIEDLKETGGRRRKADASMTGASRNAAAQRVAAVVMTAVLVGGSVWQAWAEPDDELYTDNTSYTDDTNYTDDTSDTDYEDWLSGFYETGEVQNITHNERQIDSLTGEAYAYYDDENGTASTVSMDTHCIYDVASYTYIYNYTSSGVDDIRASVYNGMTVNGTVTIEVAGGLNYKFYRNGYETELDQIYGVSYPGYYLLQITLDNGDLEEPLAFTIMGDYSDMKEFPAPEGFAITKVLKGQEEVAFTPSQVSLAEEGEYQISYQALRSNVEYTFHTIIDHTPPTLKLKALNKKNQARSAVSLKDYKDEDIISITLDGKKIEYEEKLTEYGRYHIILQDQAGNITEYDFDILVYISGSGIAFMILFVGVFVGLGMYISLSKRKLRVR